MTPSMAEPVSPEQDEEDRRVDEIVARGPSGATIQATSRIPKLTSAAMTIGALPCVRWCG